MDSRTRVLTALNHREPDRVPVDFWWSHETRDRLLNHLRLRDTDELQDFLGSDIRCVYPTYCGPPLERFGDGSYRDWWGVIRKPYKYGSGEYDEVIYSPLREAESYRDVEKIPWPNPNWFDYDSLNVQCDRYHGRAIMIGRMGLETQTLFIQTWFTRGLDKVLLDFVLNPDLVKAMMDKIMAFRVEHLQRILKVAGPRADLLQMADDYGTQKGLMISPETWRTFFAPHLQTLCRMAHDAGLNVFLHCCGSSRQIIPDLIDLGVDVLNPIQPQAAGMDPADLKTQFGDRLSFHGAIDTQSLLPFGSPNDVFREVKHAFETLGRGGGYILAPVHTVEGDVPVENVLAVYEAARKYGRYRGGMQ